MKIDGASGPRLSADRQSADQRIFKRDVCARLLQYRSENGLGCYAAVARASGGKLTAHILRGMIAGDPYPITFWIAADQALNKITERRS